MIDGAAVTALDAEKTSDGEALAFKNELMQSDDFLSWIGAPVIVYDGAEQSGKLIRARCLMRESEQNQTRARLETLIARWNEDAVSAADILAVSTEAKKVVVNLSGRLCRVAANAGWRRGAREGLFDGQYDDAGAEPAERDLLF